MASKKDWRGTKIDRIGLSQGTMLELFKRGHRTVGDLVELAKGHKGEGNPFTGTSGLDDARAAEVKEKLDLYLRGEPETEPEPVPETKATVEPPKAVPSMPAEAVEVRTVTKEVEVVPDTVKAARARVRRTFRRMEVCRARYKEAKADHEKETARLLEVLDACCEPRQGDLWDEDQERAETATSPEKTEQAELRRVRSMGLEESRLPDAAMKKLATQFENMGAILDAIAEGTLAVDDATAADVAHAFLMEGIDVRAAMRAIGEPKAAPEADDGTWRTVRLETIGLAEKDLEVLNRAGLETMGDVAEFTKFGPLTRLDGIGPASNERICAVMDRFWAKRAKERGEKPQEKPQDKPEGSGAGD